MRSCEYTFVGYGERKTRAIRAKDVVFWIGNRVIPHSSPSLHKASSVSIDFGDQKSEIKDETVSQDANNKGGLNPDAIWAKTIRRLRSYPNYRNSWEVFTFYDGSNFTKITPTEVLITLRSSVDCIGTDILGFSSKDIGTHSIRASLAMMMYLAKEPTYTIMLIGRWSSDAFLAYIEKQIKEFTKGVSTRMLENDHFFNIPLAKDTEGNKGRSHHRQANLNIFGRQAGSSLRHQLCPQN